MAQDFTDLATTEGYAALLTHIGDRDVALALAFDPAYTSPTNVKTRTVRWNSVNGYWEYYTGSVWSALASTYNITAAKASNITGGAAGGLLYQSAADTTAKLALGTTNYVLTAGASAPQWVAQSTLSVASAATAGDSANLGGVAAASYAKIGKQTVWVPSGAMTPRITNGPSVGLTESTTNKLMLSTLNFDATTAEYAQFTIAMPKSWNAGTVTFKALVSHASGTGNVIFSLSGISFASDDALDGTAFPAAVTHSALTIGTANDIYISAESSALTITGAGKSEYVTFQVARDTSDTLAVDARLHGIQLFYTTDAQNDA